MTQFTHETYQDWYQELNLSKEQREMISRELERLTIIQGLQLEVDYYTGRQDAFNAVWSLINGHYDATDYCPSKQS